MTTINRIWYTDLETFWSPTHTLTKLNPVEYCMHRDTEIQSMSCAFDDEPMQFIRGEEAIRDYIAGHDFANTLAVAHNMSGFDAMLLAWRLGLRPGMWGCTLAMAKPVYRAEVGGSLSKLCDHLKLGHKGSLEATNTKGRKGSSFSAAEWQAMEAYNNLDTELCRRLFKHLLPHIPKREMQVIDMTIRMLVSPKIRVDVPMLQAALAEEKERKENAIETLREQLGLAWESQLQKVLMSNPQFADLLKILGVEPPLKISPTTGKETFAFAKQDEGMLGLLEHDNPLVQAAASTRLGVKSTILESRIETFLTMAAATGGRMPIALNYCGAATWRWSGGFKANQQNLPRCNPKVPKPSDALRMSLIAPKGHKIVVADLSGIELRVNHFLWQVPSSMELYAGDAEADLYKEFASNFYGISKDQVTKDQRQFAKMVQLGLGFGMGWRKFKEGAKKDGYTLSDNEARDVVTRWRQLYREIANGWSRCDEALNYIGGKVLTESYLADGNYVPGRLLYENPIDPWGLCVTGKDCINTPFGKLRYPSLHQEGDGEWWYGEGRFRSKAYGGLICENLVQHLARQVLVGQMLKIQKQYPIAHTVHDEVILVVPDAEAQDALDFMLDTMKTPPNWWPDLVLFAEGDIADSYGKAK